MDSRSAFYARGDCAGRPRRAKLRSWPPIRSSRRRRSASPGRRSIRSCSASTTTTPTRRGNDAAGPGRVARRPRASARTSRATTAGACTTARSCRASRSTRTAASRPSPSCAAASSITPTRSARPRASAAATCSGSPPARGIVHSEMFPLLDRERAEPASSCSRSGSTCPRADKLVEPHFAMLWDEDDPAHVARDDGAAAPEVTVVAGALGATQPPAPPPDSWAARPDADVAIWTIALDAGARAGRCRPRAGARTVARCTCSAGTRCASAGERSPARHRECVARSSGARSPHGGGPVRAPAAPGPADRRAGRAARAVRDEHARPRSSRRSSTTSARSSAAGRGRRRAGASARARPLRAACRRARRGVGGLMAVLRSSAWPR